MQLDSDRQFPADMYRVLFEQACDAIFVLDEQAQILAVNQTACDYLGYTRDELLKLSPRQIAAPEFSDSFAERFQYILEKGEATFELMHRHRDGSLIPVEMHSRMLSVGDRRLLLSVSRDISVRKRSEIEYRSIIQAAGDGYWAVRASDARIIDVNDTFCAMVGYSREELLTMRIPDLDAAETEEETAAHIQRIIETGHDLFETRHRHKDGHILEFEISVSYAPLNGGLFFVFTRDISARKQVEAEQSLATMIFNASTASIMATDRHNNIVSVNPAFVQSSGYQADELIGKNPRILQSGRQDGEFYQRMWQALERNGHWEGEWWNRRKDGELYAEHVVMNVVRNADGSVYRYVKISTDITAKMQLDELLQRQAHYDVVTNLPNRRFFYSQVAKEIRRCQATGGGLAIYFIDLDGFKQVNDTHGHDVGDQLLLAVAQRISSCVRSTDLVARIGGDEFTVMLAGMPEHSRIDAVVGKILEQLAEPFQLDGVSAAISASIGISLYPEGADEVEALIRQADQAMYRAKNNGKNTYAYLSDAV